MSLRSSLLVTLNNQLNNKLDNIANNLAKAVYDKSQSIVPVDTGELKNSCKIDKVDKGHYRVVYDSDHAIYAHEQPQSSRKNGYSQFLRIAVEDVSDDVDSVVKVSKGSDLL